MGNTAALVVLAGIVLFFVPEPITSILGVLVLLAGLALYVLR